jgi:hypothetical protein
LKSFLLPSSPCGLDATKTIIPLSISKTQNAAAGTPAITKTCTRLDVRENGMSSGDRSRSSDLRPIGQKKEPPVFPL